MPSIQSLEASHWKSLGGKVRIHLGPLTAFVGPNSSGKSNVTDALRFLSEAVRFGLEAAVAKRGGIGAIRHWPHWSVSLAVQILISDYNVVTYGFEIGVSGPHDYRVRREYAITSGPADAQDRSFLLRKGEWVSGPLDLRPSVDPSNLALPLLAADERFHPVADVLRSIAVYSIYPDALREPQKFDAARPMQEQGSNWCSILRDLMKNSDRMADFRAAMGKITGDIDDARVRQVGGYLVTEFRHGMATTSQGKPRAKWFESAQESDGTLRVAGILAALLQEPPLTLLGIEEPELTIHPGALPVLYDFLKEASTRSQVVLTTHSPDLLSLMEADEVRVVERRDGSTTAGPMEESQREAVKDGLFTPGDLLRMEGLHQAEPRTASVEP